MRGIHRKVAVLATVCALGSGVWPAVARPLSAYREYDSGAFTSGGFTLTFPRKGEPLPQGGRGGDEFVSPMLLPLSVSSFRPMAGGPIMPRRLAEGVRTLDTDGRRQLEASLLLLLEQYDKGLDRGMSDPSLKNNLAGAFNFLFNAAYGVLKDGRTLSPEQQKSMLQQFNAGFSLSFKDQRLTDRQKQELYESAVLSGSIIQGLYSEGKASGQGLQQRTARELARELLTRLMGLSIEQVHTEGNAVWVAR